MKVNEFIVHYHITSTLRQFNKPSNQTVTLAHSTSSELEASDLGIKAVLSG